MAEENTDSGGEMKQREGERKRRGWGRGQVGLIFREHLSAISK